VGSAGLSGMITDDPETFILDNVESDVFGVACAAPDSEGLSNKGSNK